MPRLLFLLALLLGLAGTCRGAAVVLPVDPPAQRSAALREVWRLGGEDEEDVLLGVVGAGIRDDSGRVYLLDSQLAQVLVISPAGELITTVGREGEGPGELRRPHSLFLTPEGLIGVVMGFPGKVVLLDLEGDPAGEITFNKEATEGGFNTLRRMEMLGDQLIGVTSRGTFDRDAGTSEQLSVLGLFDRQGVQQQAFGEFQMKRDFRNPVIDEAESFSPFAVWAVGPDGPVYTAPEREAYRIAVTDLEGNPAGEMTRDFAPRKRTQEDKDRIGEDFRIVINGRRQLPENRSLDHDRAILGLTTAADGRLFVVNSYQNPEHLPAGVAGRFDVLSPAGEFLEELTLTLAGCDPQQDRLVFLDGRYFLVIHNFESARDSMRAGLGDDADGEEDVLAAVEPLEVGLYVLAD